MPVEHFDVLIVGAGLSGIGAGYHLQTECPDRSYAILEARGAIGGTWDLFRYPGIRSDSDMFTLGYSFRPWTEAKAIADGPSILRYVRDTAREFGIDQHIRFNQRVRGAAWSSADSRWTVEAETGPGGERSRYSCNFLYLCSGYYNYDAGYAPHFAGSETFKGQLVHPQQWPQGLDYSGKRVVVIGSGATAVTLVPAMTDKAAHVTMLQRSPSYILSLPAVDPLADVMRRVLPECLAHRLARWKNVLLSMLFYQMSRRWPEFTKSLLRRGIQRSLPDGFPVDVHFKPSYQPWDQRLCLIPDADLFKVIKAGSASIVTDHIDTFTAHGIRLKSGTELPADIIVTATGLQLQACGGATLEVDGRRIDPGRLLSYNGLMLSGVPNLAVCIGYTNASWTLRADLSSTYVCRLLNHMRRNGYRQCVPINKDPAAAIQPMLELQSGYVQRSIDLFPKQGPRPPWRVHQNYVLDLLSMKYRALDDGALVFSSGGAVATEQMQKAA